MTSKNRKLLGAIAISIAAGLMPGTASADAGFKKWINGFYSTAAKNGISQKTYNQAFAGYHFKGETFDCGAKDGFILANVSFAIERADIRPMIEEPLKALLAALK